MSKELYLLVDGTHAHPDDCDVGADNELRHGENGVPVALNEDGSPQTVKQGAIDNKNVEAAEAAEAADKEAAEINEASKADEKAGKQPPRDDLLLKTDDLRPEPKKSAPVKAKAVKPAKAKTYKNREMKAR